MSTTDLLRRSAPLALAAAPGLCRLDPATGERCDWYHGPWQVFRLLDLVSTAAVHETMLLDDLRSVAREGGSTRVLVSGTTDYAVLAMVLEAWADAQRAVEVTVLDACPTPLLLCDWYARERGARVATHAGDILDFSAQCHFDVICTHAFLGYFDADARADLLQRWHRLLRPGGHVITMQRLRPGHPEGLARFTTSQAIEFQRRADEAAGRLHGAVEIEPREFLRLARSFTENFETHPIRSREEIRTLFAEAGFHLERLDFRRGDEHGAAGADPGPSVPGAAEYAHIVAVRDGDRIERRRK